VTTRTALQAHGVDEEAIRSALAPVAENSVAVIGGSFADGLGSEYSDIDIYIVADQSSDGPPGPSLADQVSGSLSGSHLVPGGFTYARIHAAAGDIEGMDPVRDVDVTIFGREALLGQASMLREQCLANGTDPRLPYPADCLLRVLHALNSGQALWGEKDLEALQTAAGSDFYPLIMVLLAFDRTFDSWRELRSGKASEVLAADAARRFTQAVVDAILGWFGRINPSDRWRLPSLQRLAEDQPDLLPWDQLSDALLASSRDGEPPLEQAVAALRMLLDSPLLCTYAKAQRLRSEVDEL
jgi:hypothetical protein